MLLIKFKPVSFCSPSVPFYNSVNSSIVLLSWCDTFSWTYELYCNE